MQDAAEKIRALGDDIFGIWQPITYNEFFKVVAQYGGALLNEDKTAFTINSPENLEAGWDLPALKDLDALSSYLEVTPPDNREAVFESLDYLVMPPVIEDYALMSDIISQKLAAAAEGTITVQEALDQAQAECEAQIKLA